MPPNKLHPWWDDATARCTYLRGKPAFHHPGVEIVRRRFVLDGQALGHDELGVAGQTVLRDRQRVEIDAGRVTCDDDGKNVLLINVFINRIILGLSSLLLLSIRLCRERARLLLYFRPSRVSLSTVVSTVASLYIYRKEDAKV